MAFPLQYRGVGLFRRRAYLEWVEPQLQQKARELGWDGRESLVFRDADGLALGGFVPR